MADKLAITPQASAAQTSNGNGGVIDIGALRSCVRLLLDVTAVSGTFAAGQGLTVSVETSPSGTTGWRQIGTFTLLATTGYERKTFAQCERYVRVKWTITGTLPSFTFSVAGDAHVLYATPADMSRTGINEAALEGIDDGVRADCCLRATDEFETALNSSYSMPITAWGEDLRGHVAARAVFHTMNHRGRDPDSGADRLIDLMGGYITTDGVKSGAQMFYEGIARGMLKPVGIVDQTPDEYEGGGFVISDAPR